MTRLTVPFECAANMLHACLHIGGAVTSRKDWCISEPGAVVFNGHDKAFAVQVDVYGDFAGFAVPDRVVHCFLGCKKEIVALHGSQRPGRELIGQIKP